MDLPWSLVIWRLHGSKDPRTILSLDPRDHILDGYPRNHCFCHLFGPPFWGTKTGQNMTCEKHVFVKSKVHKTLPLPFKVFAPCSVFDPCFWHGTHPKMGPKMIDFGVPSLDPWVSILDTLFDPSGTVIHRSSGMWWSVHIHVTCVGSKAPSRMVLGYSISGMIHPFISWTVPTTWSQGGHFKVPKPSILGQNRRFSGPKVMIHGGSLWCQKWWCEKHVFAKSKVFKTLPFSFKVFTPYSIFAPCF